MKPETDFLMSLDWTAANDHLTDAIKKCLNGGSVGIGKYYNETVRPLWQRYERGERSAELYDAIMNLK